jgi:hypothetical protein
VVYEGSYWRLVGGWVSGVGVWSRAGEMKVFVVVESGAAVKGRAIT